MPTKTAVLSEGKSKILHTTDDPNLLIQEFKDDATAFNGVKKGTIVGKGVFNQSISTSIFRLLEQAGIKTHLVEVLNDREQLVKRVDIVMVEFVVRNIAAGSLCRRYATEEGLKLERPMIEYFVKSDELGDPLIGREAIAILGLADYEILDLASELTMKVNEIMVAFWKTLGIDLVDFKLEFGRDNEGNLLLADEITPDGCRLWDTKTGEKLDKDRFRFDMGGVEESYARLQSLVTEAAGV
ncbi:MAG: phosphoribosylaminoimidazolesuccinocarboxamide synthase [Proteobacteria bacterium]|nr:phosphoribosylaminoimidazolesuccinocarboxamide synthase [Pseudomonadota bacterium]